MINSNKDLAQQDKVARVVQVTKANENLEWLERSLTCISDLPRDVDELRTEIQKAVSETILIRDLGKFSFLLTMESKEAKEKLKLDGQGCLSQWFSSINDWMEEDVCQSRRIWLEIVGIPIQLWNQQNIRKIAKNWGDVVFVEKDTAMKMSFAS